jgi:hypothetical protein
MCCAKANELATGVEKATKNQANEHMNTSGGRVNILEIWFEYQWWEVYPCFDVLT